jgi:elongation factor G
MGFIDNVAPSATEMPPAKLADGGELKCSPEGQTVLFTFKTVIEPKAGHISLFKVICGEVKEGMELVNENTGSTEGSASSSCGWQGSQTSGPACSRRHRGHHQAEGYCHSSYPAHAGKAIKLQPIEFPEPRLRQ